MIIDSLKAELSTEIVSISPFRSLRVWIIIFKEMPTFLLGEALYFDGFQVPVIDASVPEQEEPIDSRSS